MTTIVEITVFVAKTFLHTMGSVIYFKDLYIVFGQIFAAGLTMIEIVCKKDLVSACKNNK